MHYFLLPLLALAACGEVPEGIAVDPGIIGGVPDGVTLTGAAGVFMVFVTGVLKLLAGLTKVAPLMAKVWFRALVPAATLLLSAAVWIMLAALGQVTWTAAINSLLAMGAGAVTWWELVGQYIFLKPKARAPAPPAPTNPPG